MCGGSKGTHRIPIIKTTDLESTFSSQYHKVFRSSLSQFWAINKLWKELTNYVATMQFE